MADAKASRQYLALRLFGVIIGLVVSLLVLRNRDEVRTPSTQPVLPGNGNATAPNHCVSGQHCISIGVAPTVS